ncbi:MAG TPA: hypothetical protein H9867_04080 [Candidatus Corynebacterium gallistercoris]|uniref:N-acetyltransferase domain-containing protein n=1 Tax=Candidatus Corynebacterium gallistercoris TaxID=2838530 RepID=A0A9D1RZP9_9CORY|nr:hypothetical protein [Candidatus Corynebacterium gallistercoris]
MKLTLQEVALHPGKPAFAESAGYQFDSYWSDPNGLEATVTVYCVMKEEDGEARRDVARISLDDRHEDMLEIALIDVREEERHQGIAEWFIDQIKATFPDRTLGATPEEELTGFWEELGWRRVEDPDELHGFKMLDPGAE